jgi:uncharacterized protein (DUF2249 family)/quercetin dioxygenase-like cupin family protein
MPSKETFVETELDVRPLRKADKHPTIFATYHGLPVGGSFVLVNDHDPRHLRDEFEADHAGGYRWEYLEREPRNWRIRITKLTSTPLPRVLVNATDVAADPAEPDVAGAIWKLQVRERDLDSNIIALPSGGGIDAHYGPDLDVLVHVLSGRGRLATEADVLDLQPGLLLWLPRRSRRQITAGPDGLRYLTVHRRRQALVLETSPLGS